MARYLVVLALVFFAIVGMTSAVAPAPESEPESIPPATDNNIIGTLDGSSPNAAPVGGPVPEGTFSPLSPGDSPSGASAIIGVSTAVGAVASALVASFFF